MTTITIVTPWCGKRAELERDYWAATRTADAQVLIIDDGSQPPLPNAYRLPANTGFSHACNVGLSLVRTDAVLFLNNDVAATHPGWLEPIRAALEPGVLVGAELRTDPHANVDGVPFPYLDGWCLAGMTDELRDLGGWDETLEEPAYYSDNLLCLEARLAGMTLREARTGLVHKRNATAGPATDPLVRKASEANRQRFVLRAREAMEVTV